MMDSTVAVQTNGLGFSFRAARKLVNGRDQVIDAQEGTATDPLAGWLTGPPAETDVAETPRVAAVR